jgi:GNAT superfamily N-acetyltransferase
VLAAAFGDDPVMQWMVPDPADRPAAMLRFFRAFTEAIGRHEQISITRDGAGTALWLPPGTHPVDESNAEAFGEAVASVAGFELDRLAEFDERTGASHPSEPNWYLNLLGVVPERQGEGIGSALLGPALARCDREGLGAYLEATTLRNRALYERHGFETIGELRFTDGPTLWPMWRAPRG